MAEDNRNRKPKRKYNPVLEWISDRLRYIELIAAIIVVILVLVFLVRGILKRNAQPQNAASQAVQSVSASASSAAAGAENNSVTPAVSSGSESVSSSSAADTLKKDTGDVNAAVQTYFGNLISSGSSGSIESYSDLTTYTYPGPTDGTYIAFVEYTYKYKDYAESIPGLSEFYVAPDDSGKLVISDDSSEEIQKAMSDAASTESAKALIADVQSKYDAVVNANEDLKNYISTLGSGTSDTSSGADSSSSSAGDTSGSGSTDSGNSTTDAGNTTTDAGNTSTQ
jgi:type II secretory pathway pseudopilin PulG